MASLKRFTRDVRGRFAVSIGGGGKRKTIGVRDVPSKHGGLAGQITSAHGGTRKSITSWSAGVWSGESARIKESYSRGRLGGPTAHPRGGTYRPVIKTSGWKLKGYKRT